MRAGRSVICQQSATSNAGLTASIWRPGSSSRRSASWSSGATPEGRKELVGFTDGIPESSQSWRDLLLDLNRRGLTTAPQIAVAKPTLAKAGGALGFWKALGEVWPTARELLGAQNREHLEQDAEEPAHQGQAFAAGDLDGGDQEGCR
jgi:hypothetical protein